jgi:membrane protease YdiL (CAAX protease family)
MILPAVLLLIPLLVFFLVGLFLTKFFINKANTKERILLIEKGIDPSALSKNENQRTNFPWLKIGIVITSISIGLLLSAFLFATPYFEKVAAGQLPLLLIFLFGGIGMILAHIIDKPKKQN